jgi:hypothetical protein
MNEIEKLSKYGLVKTCKVVHEKVVTIVITSGFSENAIKTFEFLKTCTECFPNHPITETLITEKDFAMVVLTAN